VIRGLEVKIEQGNGVYFWDVKYREGEDEKELLGNTETIYEALRDVRNVIAPLIQAPDGRLSKRRLEILRLLVRGKTYGQVALELGITERTVKDQMMKARRALGCENVVQLAYTAIVMGYLP